MTTFYSLSSTPSDRTGDLPLTETEALALLSLNRDPGDTYQADTAREHPGEVWIWEDPYAGDIDGVERYRWSESRPEAVHERGERADDI